MAIRGNYPPAASRRRRTLLTALAATLAMLVPAAPASADGDGDGNALDRARYNSSGTYQLRAHNFEGRIKRIRDRPGVWGISFGRMIAGRSGRMYRCGTRCRDWQSSADDSHVWYPQGLAGSKESRWSGAPSSEVIASAWYKRRTSSDHTAVASAIKFVSTYEWKYRHVPLRRAVKTSRGWRTRPLRTHAGGVAWAGP